MIQEKIKEKWTTDINSEIYQDSIAIRHQVFIKEQEFPEESSIDHLEVDSEHLVLYNEKNTPLATARINEIEDNYYRIERVSVLKEARKMGLGKILIYEMEDRISKNGGNKITLNSESHAVNFYKKYGYEEVGGEFLRYHIMHQEMVKEL